MVKERRERYSIIATSLCVATINDPQLLPFSWLTEAQGSKYQYKDAAANSSAFYNFIVEDFVPASYKLATVEQVIEE